jgi:hypothetical protein
MRAEPFPGSGSFQVHRHRTSGPDKENIMRATALAFAATLALTGAALAQATTTPGSTVGSPAGGTERNLNNPGSVKSNAEKGMPGRDMPAATGTVAPVAPGAATRTDDLPSHSGGNAAATSPANRAR